MKSTHEKEGDERQEEKTVMRQIMEQAVAFAPISLAASFALNIGRLALSILAAPFVLVSNLYKSMWAWASDNNGC